MIHPIFSSFFLLWLLFKNRWKYLKKNPEEEKNPDFRNVGFALVELKQNCLKNLWNEHLGYHYAETTNTSSFNSHRMRIAYIIFSTNSYKPCVWHLMISKWSNVFKKSIFLKNYNMTIKHWRIKSIEGWFFATKINRIKRNVWLF